jgi:hypothetical protein
MSKTYITIANADSQYCPVTRSNDMLLFAGSADQRVVIGVGANVGMAEMAGMAALVPNFVSVGSNDTIVGNNLIVRGTIKDANGAEYSATGWQRFCAKNEQVPPYNHSFKRVDHCQ